MQDELPKSCMDCVVLAICDLRNKNGSWKHKESKVPCAFEAENSINQ